MLFFGDFYKAIRIKTEPHKELINVLCVLNTHFLFHFLCPHESWLKEKLFDSVQCTCVLPVGYFLLQSLIYLSLEKKILPCF